MGFAPPPSSRAEARGSDRTQRALRQAEAALEHRQREDTRATAVMGLLPQGVLRPPPPCFHIQALGRVFPVTEFRMGKN